MNAMTERLNRRFGKVMLEEKVVSLKDNEMAKKSDLPKGFFDRAGRLYVSGKHKGKTVCLNTGKAVNNRNISWANDADREQVFFKLIVEKEEKKKESGQSLKAFGDAYLEKTSYKREAPTHTDYTNLFHDVILNDFGSFEIKDIKVQDVEAFLWKIKEEHGGSRCVRIKGIFSRILASAADHELIRRNPFEYQDIKDIAFDTAPKKVTPYTRGEILAILKHSKGWLHLFLHLGFVYGMRPGEVLHLQWKNIDLENNMLYMKGSISKGVILNGNACTPDGKIIKRHVRDVKIFKETVALLKEHYLSGTKDTDWLFTPGNKVTNWTDIKSINENHFQPLLEKIGVEYKTIKVMRNSSITQQLGQGRSFAFNHMLSGKMDKDNETLRAIQEEVGHAPGSDVTLSHYYKPESLDHTEEMEEAEKTYNSIFAAEDEEVTV